MRNCRRHFVLTLGLSVAVAVLSGCDPGGGVSPSSAPRLASLQPVAAVVGTRVTITGTGFQDTENTINFGASAYPHIAGENGMTIVFVIPTATNPPCRNATPPCAILSALITPGVYAISVSNSQGTSNSISFTVTSS